MDNIQIIDDFLNKEYLDIVLNILKNHKWQYGHVSNGTEKIDTPFWNIDLMDNQYLKTNVKSIIENIFSRKFELLRVYANGQTFGQSGSYHMDSPHPNCMTFCLYFTPIKKEESANIGGHLYIKVPYEKKICCIEPVFNRGVLFPSNYYHKGCAFDRYYTELRICLTWKLKDTNDK